MKCFGAAFFIFCLLPASLWAQLPGFLEDFNDNLPTGWDVYDLHKRTFNLAEENGVLKIMYTRTADSGAWDNFNYTPPQAIAVPDYPVITLQVKSDIETKLTFKPVYSNGKTGWLQHTIAGDETWHDVVFNLIAHGGSNLDMIYMYLDGGSTSPVSGTVYFDNLTVGDTTPRPRVTDLVAVPVDANRVDLTWSTNLPDQVNAYHVYRSEDSGFTCDTATSIGTTSETSFSDSGLTTGHTYYYRVSLVDTSGTESDVSAEVSAHIYPPGAQRLFEAEHATYSGLSLVTEASASNGQYLQAGDTASLKWAFSLADAGWYEVRIGYKNTGADARCQFIKNGVNWDISLGWSRDWSEHLRWVPLQEGTNTLEIAANGYDFSVDYVRVEAATLEPHIAPVNNTIYTAWPRDLIIKVNAYGRTITGITANHTALLYEAESYPYEEDAWKLRIRQTSLAELPVGIHQIAIHYDTGESSVMNLTVASDAAPALLTIIAPYVSHGNAVLIICPTGKSLLIDCGDETWRDRVVVPLLQENGITKLDYFFITHYDVDHDSGDRGETIKTVFQPDHFYDNNDFTAGQSFDLENMHFKILNVDTGGTDLNANSLSFKLEYRGFIYNHGADIYSSNQQTILSLFPADVPAHVYSANHHFHGSLLSDYIRTMDPYLVFLQAEQAIYSKSAYTQTYQIQTEQWLKDNGKRLIETLPTVEVGTVVIRVNSGEDWTYEVYGDTEIPHIPGLSLQRR